MKNKKGTNKNQTSRHRRLKGRANLARRKVNVSPAANIINKVSLKPAPAAENKSNSFKGFNLLNLWKTKKKIGQEKRDFNYNDSGKEKPGASITDIERKTDGRGSKRFYQNSRLTSSAAAVLLFSMLATAIISTIPRARAEEWPLPTPTIQLAKEYIYAGSRMLAVEDYGIAPNNQQRTNVALVSSGASVSVSSQLNSTHTGAGLINGDRKGLNWGNNTGWNDSTPGSFPDWVQIDFNGTKSIDEINVFGLQDNYLNPIEPTETMTSTVFGITALEAQYWDGAGWTTVPNGAITNNNKIWSKFTFSPIAANKIRILIHGNLAGDGFTRLAEVEAYGN